MVWNAKVILKVSVIKVLLKVSVTRGSSFSSKNQLRCSQLLSLSQINPLESFCKVNPSKCEELLEPPSPPPLDVPLNYGPVLWEGSAVSITVVFIVSRQRQQILLFFGTPTIILLGTTFTCRKLFGTPTSESPILWEAFALSIPLVPIMSRQRQ